MITVTEQLKNVFEANPLYSKEGQGLNAEVIARFFLPFSSVVWLVTEAEQQEDGDWLFFGYCHIQYMYLQPIITQYFIDNKSEIWLLFLIAHSKR